MEDHGTAQKDRWKVTFHREITVLKNVSQIRGNVRWASLVPSAVVLSLLWLLVARTYPMMYPGYDIWWHLDVIDSVDYFDGQSYGRWHWIWNRIFTLFQIDDVFQRALRIHRWQFAISVGLLFVSSELILSTVFVHSTLGKWGRAMLSTVAVVTWFVMHGTSSSTMYGAEASAVTLSWIGWYSVSHQITLPLYLFSSALLLHAAVRQDIGRMQRWAELLASFCIVAVVGLLHAAEIPYYLFMLIISFFLFYPSGHRIKIALVGVPLLLLVAYFFNRYSHGNSPLLQRVFQGRWLEIFDASRSEGALLEGGLNRGATSWNGLYSLSVMLGGCLLLFVPTKWLKSGLSARPLCWVMLSGLMPAMLFSVFTAGVLAQVTYLTLAWRFSFSSFLFLVPAIFLGVAVLNRFRLKMFFGLLMVSICVLGVIRFLGWGSFGVVKANAASVVASFDPEKVHFGLRNDQRLAVRDVAERIKFTSQGSPFLCVDAFSAYYLFYVGRIRQICLPERIREAPTALKYFSARPGELSAQSTCRCSFDASVALPGELGTLPRWKTNLLK